MYIKSYNKYKIDLKSRHTNLIFRSYSLVPNYVCHVDRGSTLIHYYTRSGICTHIIIARFTLIKLKSHFSTLVNIIIFFFSLPCYHTLT